MKILDLCTRKVKGDGFCFWRSLSVCLYGNEEKYLELLNSVLKIKNRDEIVSKTWVEFWEIVVISRILNLNISIIHQSKDRIFYEYLCRSDGSIHTGVIPKTFDILSNNYIFFNINHYDPLIRKDL